MNEENFILTCKKMYLVQKTPFTSTGVIHEELKCYFLTLLTPNVKLEQKVYGHGKSWTLTFIYESSESLSDNRAILAGFYRL